MQHFLSVIGTSVACHFSHGPDRLPLTTFLVHSLFYPFPTLLSIQEGPSEWFPQDCRDMQAEMIPTCHSALLSISFQC